LNRAEAKYQFEDVFTSSAEYASRFSGAVGDWLLAIQEQTILQLVDSLLLTDRPVFDLGGAHGQFAPIAKKLGKKIIIGASHIDAFRQLRERNLSAAAEQGGIVGSVLNWPLASSSFELVSCLRLLSHIDDWQGLIKEMCRVSDSFVLVEYPTFYSANLLNSILFPLKKKLEGNTRTFTCFKHSQIDAAFRVNGYELAQRKSQFVWPMVLHRKLKSVIISKLLERSAKLFCLDRLIGNPSLALYKKSK
jgi:SAM-dependent methyltransferase